MNYGRKIEKVIVTDRYGIATVVPKVLMSGQVCRVDYIKSDGSVTTMLCRTGVGKYVKGTGKSPTDLSKGRLSVYAFDRQGYRTLKLDKILTIKHGGILYDFRNMYAHAAYRDEHIAEAKDLMMPPGEYGCDLYGGRTVEAHTSPMYKD
jgi:hypothetical protein